MITVIFYNATESRIVAFADRVQAFKAAYEATRDGYTAVVNL